MDKHAPSVEDVLTTMTNRITELEQLVHQLEGQLMQRVGQQLDSLSEHVEYRFQGQHERIKVVDDQARNRDQQLWLAVDGVRSDAESWARDARAGRDW